MSKSLGKVAAQEIARDIYGARLHGGFRLSPPADFEFFNSLRLVDVDTFSGVSVALVKSVLWKEGATVTSRVQVDGAAHYSGSHNGPLPAGVTLHSETYWLAVISQQLASQGAAHSLAVEAQGCAANVRWQEHFFMFLRAHGLVSFNEALRLRATEEVSYQPEASDYLGTSVADLYAFYEPFALYEVSSNSPLVGRTVFWYSYLVASSWKTLPNSHVSLEALHSLRQVYDTNLWHFPIDNARIAITASHFKHTYVDLYRCLEWLYSIPRALMVKQDLALTAKATELARTFREKLAWRRAEQDSLRLLVLDCGVETLDLNVVGRCMLDPLPRRPIEGVVTEDGQPETEEKWRDLVATAIAKRIYAVRNQIVHQLDQLDEQEVKKEQQPALIDVLARLCITLYTKYAAEF